MPIKTVTVGTSATTLLKAGQRSSVIVANPDSNASAVWVQVVGDDAFKNTTPTNTDNTPSSPLAVGNGIPVYPGSEEFFEGANVSQEIKAIAETSLDVGVTEFHNDVSIEIV